jgi:hypothetical protein
MQRNGTLGLLATNTIAQGDTRQTGLDRIVNEGGVLYRATNDLTWPGRAAVVVNVVHLTKRKTNPPFILDGRSVQHISSFLDSRKVVGDPYQLAQNKGKSHMGSNVVGIGFAMTHEQARELISKDARNAEVLFPYINGQDLNSTPFQSPSRQIINFFDWPLRKGITGSWFEASKKQQQDWLRHGTVPDDYPGPVAHDYPDCMDIVRAEVYPSRVKLKGGYARYWWQYGRRQEQLYEAIASLRQTLAIALTSNTMAFAFLQTNMVFSHAVIVIAFEDYWALAVLQSTLHTDWARRYGSSMKGDARYTPTDCFETFPLPHLTSQQRSFLDHNGEAYHEHRRQIMLARQEGLTKTYNRFHDPDDSAEDITWLRELHMEMDRAVAATYGWDDLDLGHGFHETAQGLRFTISEPARREVLTRLLELNHERYAEEVRLGLHEKKGKKATRRRSVKRKKTDDRQMSLF